MRTSWGPIAGALVVASMSLTLAFQSTAIARAADLPATATDPGFDVFFTNTPGDLSKADRTSIDILKVSAREANGGVTFNIGIRDARDKKSSFDQMAFLSIRGGKSSDWVASIGLSAQDPKAAFAYLYKSDSSYVSCDPLSSKVLHAKEVLRIAVPNRCLPTQPGRIKVETLTGQFRSDAPIHSRDRAKFAGKVRLR